MLTTTNIILLIIVIILIWNYKTIQNFLYKKNVSSNSTEDFDIMYSDETISYLPQKGKNINSVVPDGSVIPIDNIMSFEQTTIPQNDKECDEINNYRVNFFAFNDRINNTSHLDDAVDNINITNKAQNYKLGVSIANIYDDLVNSNKYKSNESSLCKNITIDT